MNYTSIFEAWEAPNPSKSLNPMGFSAPHFFHHFFERIFPSRLGSRPFWTPGVQTTISVDGLEDAIQEPLGFSSELMTPEGSTWGGG